MMHTPNDPIAIVGIGCRLPGGANSPDAFWHNLIAGVDAITEVPANRWNAKQFFDPHPGRPGKTVAKWGGFVENIDRFDPQFFGLSPREAARMDPQQRMLLEVAWEALEDAGLPLPKIAGSRAAVFVGISSWDYSILQTGFRDRGGIDMYSNTGGSLSIAANRISYCFDLKGPSAAVDTACSSALVALHLACRSIWNDGCPLALVGGANALLAPDWYIGFSRMGMLSPDGRCKAFDARGNGFVRAEGAGMVVLKPLSQALGDGDRIYATIRGTAVNQDGRTPGMTVPDRHSQEELLREACRSAGVSPARIQYIEAHGTGTPVGDPIEAAALGAVLAGDRPADQPCLLGSVKTNIGHLEAGSGIAGLIKLALSLHHGRIPANLHFERPNPEIDFDRLRLRVPVQSEPWPRGDGVSLAGINSFGFGGTNAHAILEAAPIAACGFAGDPTVELIPLSAKNPESLRSTAETFARFIAESPESLADIACNASTRRTHHDHRLAVVARTKHETAEALTSFVAGQASAAVHAGRASPEHRPKLAFVCAGQGPQWWAMGRQLLEQELVFRDVIEQCDAIVTRLGSWSLLEEMMRSEADSRMSETAISQPAIFALQVALAAVWRTWGVQPEAVIGHSVGEVAAAHLAGVFDLEDAVRVIYHRGRSMELAPSRGRMLAAGITPEDAERLLAPHGERVSLAAINGPASVTISGEAAPLQLIADELQARGVFAKFLQVNYAFHSAQMEPIRDELLRSLKDIRPQPARLPLISTVTGKPVVGPELDAEYWWHNVRRSVRFAAGVEHLINAGFDTTLELSSHPVLTSSVTECYRHRGKTVAAQGSLRRSEIERATLLYSLADLYVRGYPVNWNAFTSGPRQFVRLPSYSWQHQACWHESDESHRTRFAAPAHPLLGTATGDPTPAWESRIDVRLTPSLADHRVQSAAILPATAYLEMAFAAARAIHGSPVCRLEDVRLTNPCFLPADDGVKFHTTFHPDDGTLRSDSQQAGSNDWVAHVQATIRPLEVNETIHDLDAIRGRCPREFDRDVCYTYCEKIGLDYGPLFRGIDRAWQGDCEALGRIVLPDELTTEAEESIFHPALFDACFHLILVADPNFPAVVGGLYLPVEVDEIRLFRQPGTRLWSHARLREKTAKHLSADIDIYDENGNAVAIIRGLRSQHVAGTGARLDEMLYAYEWRANAIAARTSEIVGTWLIVADRDGVGARLAAELQAAGEPTIVIDSGAESLNDAVHSVLDVRGIVYLPALDLPANEELRTADLNVVRELLLAIVQIVQTWDANGRGAVPPLVLVTRGAQSVGEEPEPVTVAQAPLIGLGRVIANEYAGLRGKLVDLDPANEQVDCLVDELHAADDEDEIAWRGTQRYVHRFVTSTGTGPRSTRTSEAYRLTSASPGTLEGLTFRALTRDAPPPGHVEVEVVAAGLNFSDVMKALGIYPGLAAGPVPFGAECSGRVAAIGDDVTEFAVGDEVFGVAPFAFASHVTTRAAFVARKPAHISFEEAAALPIAFLTAEYALGHLAHLSAGERVLIHSATGGVGLAAIQIARRAGAEIFATAGTPEKRDFLRKLGIERAMDSRTLSFADDVKERTSGRGVDVVLNSLAGEAIARGLDCLGEYGRFLEIGKRDIYANGKVGLAPFHRNLSFFAIDLDRVMRERPAILGRLLRKLATQFHQRELSPLPCRVFPVADVAAAFRHMQGGKHIGKVVLSMCERPATILPSDEPLRFRADASYLIVGGLGGFGLAVAKWMAECGAGHLVLVGRRGVHSDDARQAVAELEARGTRVTVITADIASEDDASRVFAQLDRGLPPLRGVVHAAMVLDDCLLLNLDDEKLARVLAPKVQGAWNLHQHTAGRALDFFAMFSSLSSVFGHAGQANYAAANAFLDGLAWFRRSRGLPALTVNWGHLGGVGYLAERRELGDRLERQGVLSFPVRDAITLLEQALQRDAVQVSVMRVDWAKWSGLGVTGRVSPRFADLLRARDPGAAAESLTPSADLRKHFAARLREKVARVLGTPVEQLDADTPLLRLGVDSLMAVELLNWIDTEVRVKLPVVELLRSPGINDLCELLLGRVTSVEPPELVPPALAERMPDVFPLSHGQRGLWLQYQRDRASPALNLSFCSRIRSPLDLPAFQHAWQTLIDRHPALRTTFEECDGELVQRIHDQAAVPFRVIDARDWSEDLLRTRIAESAAEPFDLERGRLMRIALFERGPDDRVFLLTAHHIIGDFWSMVLLLGDMRTLYPAACAGRAPALPPPTGNYHDYVRRQSALLAGAEGERLWDWWREQLAGVSPVLELPTDRPRPARFTHRAGVVPCRLDAELIRGLKELAASENVTLYVVLLAAYQALLGRTADREEFVVGSPFAGRGRQEFESVVGYFTNMLPLRADLTGDPPFRELLRRTNAAVLHAFEHQDFPFALLVERLKLPRDQSRTPLVQATFAFNKAHQPAQVGAGQFLLPHADSALEIGGLRIEPFPIEQGICQADVELVLEESDGGVEGMLCFNADLFDRATVERMVGHFRTLLAGAIVDAAVSISRLPWLTAQERQQMERWNATEVMFPHQCLHELFEKQAAKLPDAVAVRCGDEVVRYGELNERANRIATELVHRGIEPGAMIGLFMTRSPELIAAMLGVLKAGAAYVPLDPDSPPARIATILEQTRSPVVLSHPPLCGKVPRTGAVPICVTELETKSDRECRSSVPRSIGSTDLAYVIFTSGSTGEPKGVMVEHPAACNTVQWRQRDLPLGPADRVLLSLPAFFDPAVVAIFPTLAAGAELVLAVPGEERDPALLVQRIERDRVTVLNSLPSVIRAMLDVPGFGRSCRTVRRICCGGEVMPPELPALLADRSEAELFNMYGPTEAAIEATWWRCDDRPRSAIPIGRPIANARVHVLDSRLHPVPVGIPGELVIGGAGLARGYLNDPELTAARFVSDPFGEPNSRLFRTGDRARWRDDGTLEFLGRLDRQVKLRGYRIEPAEVETAILADPAIHEAAVAVRSSADEPMLVAYVVPQECDVNALRRRLAEVLPSYMVPAAYHALDALPRTSTGKVDVHRLPAPSHARSVVTPPTGPRTELERFLTRTWEDVLGLESVGIDDNFFDAGGSSLQAVSAAARLREYLGRSVPVAAVFDSPTIRALAARLEEPVPHMNGKHVIRTPHDMLVPLQTEGLGPPLFLVHPPGGMVACYQNLARELGTERPVFGIRARGVYGDEPLPETLEEMASEYVAAIRGVQPAGPYFLGGWSLGGVAAFEMARQLQAAGEEVEFLALLDTTLPFGTMNEPYLEGIDRTGREYGFDLSLEALAALNADEQLPYLWDHVCKMGLVRSDAVPELVRATLDDVKRLFHTHVRLASEYALQPYAGRATLFRPADSLIESNGPDDRGWGRVIESVEVVRVPGEHHTMVNPPHVATLAAEIKLRLNGVLQTT